MPYQLGTSPSAIRPVLLSNSQRKELPMHPSRRSVLYWHPEDLGDVWYLSRVPTSKRFTIFSWLSFLCFIFGDDDRVCTISSNTSSTETLCETGSLCIPYTVWKCWTGILLSFHSWSAKLGVPLTIIDMPFSVTTTKACPCIWWISRSWIQAACTHCSMIDALMRKKCQKCWWHESAKRSVWCAQSWHFSVPMSRNTRGNHRRSWWKRATQ